MTKLVLPKTFPGATKASVSVISLLAVFLAVLFALAVLRHMDRQTLELTGAGAILFAVFAVVQVRTLREGKHRL